jgi:uncharacterized protein involved in propanediol utilization
MQIDLTNADTVMSELIDNWCARRALGPLREILLCYPRTSGLTDEWADLAACFKAIRVRLAAELTDQELEQVIALQHLAESIVYR